MESLSSIVSPLDEMDIFCRTHNNLAMGVCGESKCQEKKFLCMDCLKNDRSCVIKDKHELICLSELLYRFFTKEQSNSIDLSQINSMTEILKLNEKEDRVDTSKMLSDYVSINKNLLKESCKTMLDDIELKINNCKKNIASHIENNIEVLKQEELNSPSYKSFLDISIPAFMKELNLKKLKEVLNSTKVTKEEKDNCINLLKKFSDKESVSSNVNLADKMVSLTSFISNNDLKKFEEKVDEKLNEIESKFQTQIDEIEKLFIIENNELIYTKSSSHYKSNPNKLALKFDLCTTAHKSNSIDGVFCTFRCTKGESLLVWGTPSFTIEIYDLKQEKIIKTVTAHTSTIFSCRHYLDKLKNKDCVVTSSYDKSIKVWLCETWTNIINIQAAHTGYYIYSVCLLSDQLSKKNYVISSAPNEFTKVWDSNGKFVREMGVNSESTYFIDSWYDTKAKKHYILNANSQDVKVYDFSTGLLFKKYAGTPQTWHMSAIVNEVNKVPQLIESDGNGNVRIWDFNNGNLLKTISTSGINLRGICLWNEQYLFSSGSDYNVKLYDLNKGVLVNSFKSHTSTVCSVQKIVHPKYGECLISHALDGKLKLWSVKK
jgi:WD40 repeat protein